MLNICHAQIYLSFHAKVEEKFEFSSNWVITTFVGIHIELLNWVPNESRPETKVVGFEFWNIFRIQNFSSVN